MIASDDEDYIDRCAAADSDNSTAVRVGDSTIADHWPCRECRAMVAVPEAAVEAWEAFNRRLEKQREQPIGKHEVMFCDRCALARNAQGTKEAAMRRANIESAIAVLRANPEPTPLERKAPTTTIGEVIRAENTLKRWFGESEGDEMIRAHRNAKQPKRKATV
jgi:hypothetical protein